MVLITKGADLYEGGLRGVRRENAIGSPILDLQPQSIPQQGGWFVFFPTTVLSHLEVCIRK